MSKRWSVLQAYGRVYETALEVRADFERNRDFYISDFTSQWDGKPINKEQMSPGDAVVVRYGRHLAKGCTFIVGSPFALEKKLSPLQRLCLTDPDAALVAGKGGHAMRAFVALKRLGLIVEAGRPTLDGERVRARIVERETVGLADTSDTDVHGRFRCGDCKKSHVAEKGDRCSDCAWIEMGRDA